MDINAVFNKLFNNPGMMAQRAGWKGLFVTHDCCDSGCACDDAQEDCEGTFVLNDMNGGMEPYEPTLEDQLCDDWICHA